MDTVLLVVSILSIFIWPLPCGGIVISTTGLIFGISRHRHRKSSVTVISITLAGIGLILALAELKFGLLDLILKSYFQ